MTWLFILIFPHLFLISQETSPIIKFSSIDYGAENQNWDITQDADNFIYIANNAGLLEFNGSRWELHKSPNNTVIRSVVSANNKIYTGSFMEFGFWEKDDTGQLRYKSLSESIKSELFEDEIIWNIEKYEKYIVFQSYDHIYFYNTDTDEVKLTTDKKNNYRLFKVNNELYIQKYDGRILHIENGNEKLIAKIPERLNVKFLLSIFSIENKLVVLTRTKGLFKIENQTLVRWQISADTLLAKSRIFSGIQLEDESFILGSISKGIISLSKDGKVTNVIGQSKGLSNNTVLDLFEDIDGNVWTGLDNGLDCLNMKSYIKEYNDRDGTVGTIYASTIHNQKLYVGTNQGLFYKNLYTDEPLKFIKGTEGQVWSLYTDGTDFFCGHNSGIFLVSDEKATLITDIAGVWNFKIIPNQEGKMLFGHYSGIAVLGKYGNDWKLDAKVKGFEISSRFLEITDDGSIWVNHENKGVYKLVLNKDLTIFDSVELLYNLPKGKSSALTKTNSSLLYSNDQGIFRLKPDSNIFVRDTTYSRLIPNGEYHSGRLVFDEEQRLWSFNKNGISYAQKGPLNNMVDIKNIPIDKNLRKTTISFENISNLTKNQYILGKTNGYLLIDLNKVNERSHQIFLDKVKIRNRDNSYLDISKNHEGKFRFNESSLSFSYNVPNYDKYTNVTYQYQLAGLNDSWSNWSEESTISFEKLPYGDYIFKAKSKIGNQISTNIVNYRFNIQKPFYLSNLALICYILLSIVLGLLIHKSYKLHYRRQNEKLVLENQRQLQMQNIKSKEEMMHLKNEKLNHDIESKNRELAISTMSVIKRNEVLRKVKKELKKENRLINEDHPVIKLIDKNLNSSKDKKMFMDAFNNADKDFLTRAKAIHPELSANDLKFCAYLRLNLSSKEIAPLLNISVKSVEVRRSRLRKKLNLNRDTNLIDHIINI